MMPLVAAVGPVLSASLFLRFAQKKADLLIVCCGSDEQNHIHSEEASEEDLSIETSIYQNSSTDESTNFSLTSYDDYSLGEMNNILGPEVSIDYHRHKIPKDFQKPKNLENVMRISLPVGYFRLRRAFLSLNNDFWNDIILSETLQYSRITSHGWDRHRNIIGEPSLPKRMRSRDIIGATKKTEYLMPKSIFVKANMAYETATITAYNEHCFAIDMKTTNPEVPFGTRFEAHTKFIVYNTGKNTCEMVCSVETLFPKGPPMGIGWQIKNAMKVGCFDVFEKIGSSIRSCAHDDDEYWC